MTDREFTPVDLLPLGPDPTDYRLISTDGLRTVHGAGRAFLEVAPQALTLLARQAITDIQHLLRPSHLDQLRAIVDDPQASPNDRFVATDLLRNACVAAGGCYRCARTPVPRS